MSTKTTAPNGAVIKFKFALFFRRACRLRPFQRLQSRRTQIEQRTDHQRADHGEDQLRQHVGAVVGQGVDRHGGVFRVAAPDRNAADEVAHEADHGNQRAAGRQRKRLIFDGTPENAAETEGGESDDIIGEDQDQIGRDARDIGEVGKAEQHLDDAHGKAGEQAPFHAVAVADDHDRKLRKEGDRAAEGELDGCELVENDGEREHDAAFGEPLNGGDV